jgi:hypothetical protein
MCRSYGIWQQTRVIVTSYRDPGRTSRGRRDGKNYCTLSSAVNLKAKNACCKAPESAIPYLSTETKPNSAHRIDLFPSSAHPI